MLKNIKSNGVSMLSSSKILAQALCDLTEHVLYKDKFHWIDSRCPNFKISFTVGTGSRTCFKFDSRRTRGKFVYGVKRIHERFDFFSSVRLLTAVEIADRGYFHGKVTPSTSLAAVVLHEFAHLIEVVRHDERNGSHTPEFYKVLDRMHQSQYPAIIHSEILNKMNQLGINDQFTNGMSAIPESQYEFWRTMRAGMPCELFINESVTPGKIEKVNRKRVIVQVGNRSYSIHKQCVYMKNLLAV